MRLLIQAPKRANAMASADYYDRHVMPEGMGSFRRAGLFAIAEKPEHG